MLPFALKVASDAGYSGIGGFSGDDGGLPWEELDRRSVWEDWEFGGGLEEVSRFFRLRFIRPGDILLIRPIPRAAPNKEGVDAVEPPPPPPAVLFDCAPTTDDL